MRHGSGDGDGKEEDDQGDEEAHEREGAGAAKTLPGTGSPLDALTAEDRKALAEVLPRLVKFLESVTMSTICGNDVAAAAVANETKGKRSRKAVAA